MSKILPIINFKANANDKTFGTNENSKYESPMTYKQYKDNCILADALGASFGGVAAFAISKLLKSDNKTAGLIGLATAAGAFICSALRGCNGSYEAKYLKNKQNLEDTK